MSKDIWQSLLEDLRQTSPDFLRELREKRRKKLLDTKIDLKADFQETLQQLAVRELHEIRKMWEFSGISQLNKSKLIAKLVEGILHNINSWLILLDETQFEFIKKMVEGRGILGLEANSIDQETMRLIGYYRKRGIIISGKYEEKGETVFYMPPEVVTKIATILEEKDLEDVIFMNQAFFDTVRGLLNYYGVFPVFKLKERIELLMEQEIDRNIYIDLLLENSYYNPVLEVSDSYVYLSRVQDKKWVIEEQQKRDELDYYPLHLDTARVSGDRGHQIWNEKQRIFKAFLQEKMGQGEGKADYCLRVLVNMIQNDNNTQMQINFLQEEAGPELSPEIINLLQDLHNHTHQWILKGYTPEDVYEEEKLQSLPENFYSLPERQEPEESRKREVGRNDPCPCGSGKKYKKCCLPEEERRERVRRKLQQPREIDLKYNLVKKLVARTGYPLLNIHYFLLEMMGIAGDILHIYKVYGGYNKIREEEILDRFLEKGIEFYNKCITECDYNCLEEPQGGTTFQPLIERGLSPEDYPPVFRKRRGINLFLLDIINSLTAVIHKNLEENGVPEDKSREIARAIYSDLIFFAAGNCLNDCTDRCIMEHDRNAYCRFCVNIDRGLPCPGKGEIALEEIAAAQDDLYGDC